MAHWWHGPVRRARITTSTPKRPKLAAAYASIQKAIELAKAAPDHERAYVSARRQTLRRRSEESGQEKAGSRLQGGDGRIIQQYPDDLDAATLYAESAMNLAAVGTSGVRTVNPRRGRKRSSPCWSLFLRSPTSEHTGSQPLLHSRDRGVAVPRARHWPRRTGSANWPPVCGPPRSHAGRNIYARVGDFAAAARSNEMAGGRGPRLHQAVQRPWASTR